MAEPSGDPVGEAVDGLRLVAGRLERGDEAEVGHDPSLPRDRRQTEHPFAGGTVGDPAPYHLAIPVPTGAHDSDHMTTPGRRSPFSLRAPSLRRRTRAHAADGRRIAASRHAPDGRSREGGQSLVEFSLILTPLFLILLGIVQFGFIFNSYVTLANAAREAAREGSIHVYVRTQTKAQNDAARNAEVLSTLQSSMNGLRSSSPNLVTGNTWTQSGQSFTNGDITITYTLPTGTLESDPRVGQELTIRVDYHQDLLFPLISALLPRDGNGRLVLSSEVTMRIN